MPDTQPTFWLYLKELFSHFLPGDSDTASEIESLLIEFATGPIAHQHETFRRFFELLATLPKAPMLAVQVGYQIPITAFAPMAIPIRFAPSMRDMLRFIARYYHLQAPLIDLTFIEEEGGNRVEINFRLPVSEATEIFAATAAFSMIDCELSHITGHKRNLSAVHLRNITPEYVTQYKTFFGIVPEKNVEQNAAIIPDDILDSQNPLADPLTFKKYVKEYEEALKQSRLDRSTAAQIKEILMARISDPPSLQEIAVFLKLSERQLRFALSKEEATYRELLQQCRIEYAARLLGNPGLPISQVAFKLGYKDLAAFNHGFKRWTGKSPSAFRKDLLAGN